MLATDVMNKTAAATTTSSSPPPPQGRTSCGVDTPSARGKNKHERAKLQLFSAVYAATDKRQESPMCKDEIEIFYTSCEGCSEEKIRRNSKNNSPELVAENMQPFPFHCFGKLCV